MPRFKINGVNIRALPMLNAMDAQERVERHHKNKPHSMLGLYTLQMWKCREIVYSLRRNAAERALRPEENAVWQAWRKASMAERKAVKLFLEQPARRK